MYTQNVMIAGLVNLDMIAPIFMAHLLFSLVAYRVMRYNEQPRLMSLLASVGVFVLTFAVGQLLLSTLEVSLFIERPIVTFYERY